MSNSTYRFLLYPLLLFTCYAAHTERGFNADTRIRCKVQQQVRHRKMKPIQTAFKRQFSGEAGNGLSFEQIITARQPGLGNAKG